LPVRRALRSGAILQAASVDPRNQWYYGQFPGFFI